MAFTPQDSTDMATSSNAVSRSTLARVFAAFWPLCLATAAWGSILLYRPPAVPADAPAEAFSAERAWRHVRAIAQRPHPCGSVENLAVAEYLLRELRALGLEVHVHEATTAINQHSPRVAVRNLAARKAGRANTQALMLVAHYDSAPSAPGAADDGAAVAALLEAVRALNSGPPLRNDLIVLLTDGEELGMLGARAFVAEHPWLRDVGLVCNFEARGSRGPVFMFESSPRNGRLIPEFARAAPVTFATSLAEAIYRRMPNDTDFTIFREAGLDGLNFAFIDGVEQYHQASDDLAHLDRRSLQHHGMLALALAQHFGNRELPVPRAPDTVHFNLIGPVLVHYPQPWVMPGVALLAAGAAAAIRRTQRAGLVRFAYVLHATVAFTVAIVLAAAADLWGAPGLARALRHDEAALPLATSATVLVVAGIYVGLRRKLNACEASAGVWLWWLLAATAAAIWLPEGSYLVFWPAVFGWLVFGFTARPTWGPFEVLAGLPSVLAVILFAPLLYQLTVAFPGSQPFVVLCAAPLLVLVLPALDALLPARWI